jgi:hypothetical protein
MGNLRTILEDPMAIAELEDLIKMIRECLELMERRKLGVRKTPKIKGKAPVLTGGRQQVSVYGRVHGC